jgi:hypothetical protein
MGPSDLECGTPRRTALQASAAPVGGLNHLSCLVPTAGAVGQRSAAPFGDWGGARSGYPRGPVNAAPLYPSPDQSGLGGSSCPLPAGEPAGCT